MTLLTILTLALSVAALLLAALALARTYEIERAARQLERAEALISYTPRSWNPPRGGKIV